MLRKVLLLTVIGAAVAVGLRGQLAIDGIAPASANESKAARVIGDIDDQRIINHHNEPDLWLSYGRTYNERRFSPLTQINRSTISQLGLAWSLDLQTNRTQEATPIVVDGVMFFTTAWSKVFAVDARSGQVLWQYDPKVPGEWARRGCCDVVNRGVAVYKGRVYFGSFDGRLIALDAATGETVWQVDTLIDRDRFYTITGAPRVANGKVFIGNGGAEFGVRGYVTAYDAQTGEQVWRFFTVPGDPSKPFENPELEMAVKTWSGGKWWEYGGGGTVWNSIVYDPEFNHLYLGVGNGAPWTRAIRSPGGGDNLFLSSIVALDADTGKMKWYYQTTPGDSWDYTAVQDIALADMEVDGQLRKVLLQAPKNGFFYVIDRSNGELLRAHPYSAVTWASHVDMETGRPVENRELDFGEEAKWVLPGSLGGHNWQAMSVDSKSGIVYIPTQEAPLLYSLPDEWHETGDYKRDVGRWNNGVEVGALVRRVINNSGKQPPARGVLKAFDPLTGKTKWAVEQELAWNGGVLATEGGLVFQGDGQGMLSAYDKDTGKPLWRFNTYTSMLAPPITFALDGTQYVSILTGGGGAEVFASGTDTAMTRYGNKGHLLVFKLGGTKVLEEPGDTRKPIPPQSSLGASEKDIAKGEVLFNNYCAMCHGLLVRSGGSIPDLRHMMDGTHNLFNRIVLNGLFAAGGMASFSDVLTEEQVDLIHHFIRARAHEDRQVELGEQEHARATWLSK